MGNNDGLGGGAHKPLQGCLRLILVVHDTTLFAEFLMGLLALTAFAKSAAPATLRPRLAVMLLAGALYGCGGLTVEQDYPDTSGGANEESGSLFDLLDFKIFAGEDAPAEDDAAKGDAAAESQAAQGQQNTAAPTGLAVNADLWRAALDTLRFMPLASADQTGGTIITDWYNDPGSAGERVKINIVISGLELRADALRVSMFREKWRGNRWVGLAASTRAERQMENIILTRARDFVIARRDTR